MTSSNLAPIPRVTSSASGQWPVLVPTTQDLSWKPIQGPPTKPIPIPMRPRKHLHLGERLPGAILKGAVIAAVVVGIVAGVLPAQVWWLNSWHWVGGLMIVGSLGILAGFDTGLITLAIIADIQAVASLPAHLPVVVGLMAACVVARIGWELMLAVITS